MTAARVLLVMALAIVGYGLYRRGGLSAHVARLVGGATRWWMIAGWAVGTLVSFGLTTFAALAVLGRLHAVAHIPPELRDVAWRLGLPAAADGRDLARLLAPLGLGAAIGLAIIRRSIRAGRVPPGLRYRSPAALRQGDAWLAPALLALSAGVSEELFFRLLLPLLILSAGGPAWLALGGSLTAFAALHRHQGWAGVAATGLVGAALFALYLDTGQLWVAMLLHVVIDLNALILRPLTTRRLSS